MPLTRAKLFAFAFLYIQCSIFNESNIATALLGHSLGGHQSRQQRLQAAESITPENYASWLSGKPKPDPVIDTAKLVGAPPATYTQHKYKTWLGQRVRALHADALANPDSTEAVEPLTFSGGTAARSRESERMSNLLRDGRVPALRAADSRHQPSDSTEQLLWESFQSRVHVNNHTTKPELLSQLQGVLQSLEAALAGQSTSNPKIAALQSALSKCYPHWMQKHLLRLFPLRSVVTITGSTTAMSSDHKAQVLRSGDGETPGKRGDSASRPFIGTKSTALGVSHEDPSPLVQQETDSLYLLNEKTQRFLAQMLSLQDELTTRPDATQSTKATLAFILHTASEIAGKVQNAIQNLESFNASTFRSISPFEQITRLRVFLRTQLQAADIPEGSLTDPQLRLDGAQVQPALSERHAQRVLHAVRGLVQSVSVCGGESNRAWQLRLKVIAEGLGRDFATQEYDQKQGEDNKLRSFDLPVAFVDQTSASDARILAVDTPRSGSSTKSSASSASPIYAVATDDETKFTRRIDQNWNHTRDRRRNPRPIVQRRVDDSIRVTDATISCIDDHQDFYEGFLSQSVGELLGLLQRQQLGLSSLANNSVDIEAVRSIVAFKEQNFSFASISVVTIERVCSLLGDEWDAFVAFQQHIRGVGSSLDRLLAFAANSLPVKSKASGNRGPNGAKASSCSERIATVDGRKRAASPQDPPPSFDENVKACARCIKDEFCGFCLDGEAYEPRDEDKLNNDMPPSVPDIGVGPKATPSNQFYFHCWEGTVNGTELDTLTPSKLCHRPRHFGKSGDVWVHADQVVPDYLSIQDWLAREDVAEHICRVRLKSQMTQPTTSNKDVPHFIAMSDLSLASDADNAMTLHRSWAAGPLGVECEREIRDLIQERFRKGQKWFYSNSRSHWFSLRDPHFQTGATDSNSVVGQHEPATLPLQEFLDDIPPYLQPSSCVHIVTDLERYRGVVAGSSLPLNDDSTVNATVMSSQDSTTNTVGLHHLQNSSMMYNRQLPWSSSILSAGAASRVEIGGPSRNRLPKASFESAPVPWQDFRVGEIHVGDFVNVSVGSMQRHILGGVADDGTKYHSGVVDAILPDGTFNVRLRSSNKTARVTRVMIKSVGSNSTLFLPRLHAFNDDSVVSGFDAAGNAILDENSQNAVGARLRGGRARQRSPPPTPYFVNATFPDYSTAKEYCQSRYSGGLCGMSDLVMYARQGYVNCNFGYIDAPDNEVARGGWDAKVCPQGCAVPRPDITSGTSGASVKTTTTTTTTTTTEKPLPTCNCSFYVGDIDLEFDDVLCARFVMRNPLFPPPRDPRNNPPLAHTCVPPQQESAFQPPKCGGGWIMCSTLPATTTPSAATATTTVAAATTSAVPSLPATFNYTGDRCVDDLVITTPEPFIEPAYCCGHRLQFPGPNSSGGENAELEAILADQRSGRKPNHNSSQPLSEAHKFREVQGKPHLRRPRLLPHKNYNPPSGQACAQLTRTECTSFAQSGKCCWYTPPEEQFREGDSDGCRAFGNCAVDPIAIGIAPRNRGSDNSDQSGTRVQVRRGAHGLETKSLANNPISKPSSDAARSLAVPRPQKRGTVSPLDTLCTSNATMAAICNEQELFDFDGDGTVSVEESSAAYFFVKSWATTSSVIVQEQDLSQANVEDFGNEAKWHPELITNLTAVWATFLMRSSSWSRNASVALNAQESVLLAPQIPAARPSENNASTSSPNATSNATQHVPEIARVEIGFREWMQTLWKFKLDRCHDAEADPNTTFLDQNLRSALDTPWVGVVGRGQHTVCFVLNSNGELFTFSADGATDSDGSQDLPHEWASSFTPVQGCGVQAIGKLHLSSKEQNIHRCRCKARTLVAEQTFCELASSHSRRNNATNLTFITKPALCFREGRVFDSVFVPWYLRVHANKQAQMRRNRNRRDSTSHVAESLGLSTDFVSHPVWAMILGEEAVKPQDRGRALHDRAAKLFDVLVPPTANFTLGAGTPLLALSVFTRNMVYDPVLDINGDGVVSKDEMDAFFQAVDTAQSGFIDFEQFRDAYTKLATSFTSALRSSIESKVFQHPNAVSARRRVSILLQRPPVSSHPDAAAGHNCVVGNVMKSQLHEVYYDPVLDLNDDGVVSSDEVDRLWAFLPHDQTATHVSLDSVVAAYQLLQLNPSTKAETLSNNTSQRRYLSDAAGQETHLSTNLSTKNATLLNLTTHSTPNGTVFPTKPIKVDSFFPLDQPAEIPVTNSSKLEQFCDSLVRSVVDADANQKSISSSLLHQTTTPMPGQRASPDLINVAIEGASANDTSGSSSEQSTVEDSDKVPLRGTATWKQHLETVRATCVSVSCVLAVEKCETEFMVGT